MADGDGGSKMGRMQGMECLRGDPWDCDWDCWGETGAK